ncbi:MiaB/RimO family radical SAM methylthiotransferase [candidate division WOR-3 bacterium]|nr:MiaB/RimO family radical SAM methylthiotransferase [candidate division WOR-3 bacterium]
MKCFIKTYGCQMNFSESRLIGEKIRFLGHDITDNIENADMIVVNACSVREHAEERALGWISSISSDKAKIYAVGCLAAHVPQKLKNAGADYVSREIKWDEFPSAGGERAFSMKEEDLPIDYEISIVKGCDRFCSYCIVPYLRGEVQSLSPEEIFADIERCAAKGGAVFNLLGQNVNRYNYRGYKFSTLLEDVSHIDGVKKLTFLTSHPADLTEEIVLKVAQNDKILKSFHLPYQTGSDKLLNRMKRGYNSEGYKNKIRMIRNILPSMRLTTDIMVGLPGETEKDFRDTLDVAEEVRFDEAYMFAYSPRKGTLENLVPERIEKETAGKRLSELITVQNSISLEKKKERLNQKDTVFMKSLSRKGDFTLGILSDFSPVLVDAPYQRGKEAEIVLTELKGATLFGRLVQ